MKASAGEVLRDYRAILSGNVGIMAISWFLFGISGSLTGPFFMLYAKALGADDFSIAIIRSAGMAALALSVVVGGFLTDYIGRVRTIVTGTSLIVITSYGYAVVQDWVQLAFLWIVDQVARFYLPALTAIVMDSLPQDRALRGFLVLNAFSSIPGLFMPVIGGYIYDSYGVAGVRVAFVISGVISTIVLALRIRGLRETLVVGASNDDVKSLVTGVLRYKSALRAALGVFLYTSLLGPLVTAVSSTYGSIYIVDVLGASKTDLGVLTSISTLTSILISLLVASYRGVSDRQAIFLASISLTLSLIFMTVPGIVNAWTMLFLALSSVLGSVSGALIGPILSVLLTRILPLEIRGRAMGFKGMLENAGAAATSIFAGLVYTSVGPVQSLLLSSFMSVSVLFYLLYLHKSAGRIISQ